MSWPAIAGIKESVIHNFSEDSGKQPYIGPVLDASTGVFYGATWAGGANGYGVIYQIIPPTAANRKWVYSVIYNIPAVARPHPIAANGIVYAIGSDITGCDCATIYSLTPPASGVGNWDATVLHSFTGGSNGAGPEGPLTIDNTGALYGTTIEGGEGCNSEGGCGTVFKLAPPSAQGQPWAYSVVYSFVGGPAGQQPGNGVIFDKQGNLYGAASLGDGYEKSLIFKLTPPSAGGEWIESVLYRFDPTSRCYSSGPLAIDANGALYGVFSAYASPGYSSCTDFDIEYVFQLAPSKSNPNAWVKTEMRAFTYANLPAGYELTAPLTVDAAGNVYGTTLSGGLNNNPQDAHLYGGTAFVLQPRAGAAGKWNYKLLFDFDAQGPNRLENATGAGPNGGLVLDSTGDIYGTTEAGGGADRGVFFRLKP
jgi:hypothetical protein